MKTGGIDPAVHSLLIILTHHCPHIGFDQYRNPIEKHVRIGLDIYCHKRFLFSNVFPAWDMFSPTLCLPKAWAGGPYFLLD